LDNVREFRQEFFACDLVIMMLSVPMNANSVLALDLQATVAPKYVVFARTSQSLIGSILRLSSALVRLPVLAFA
jgi:hypothetical protein